MNASSSFPCEVFVMAITVEAIYENGVLKPTQPLPFREHETVQVTVQGGVSRARQTAGLLPWTGDPALLERFIMDPELDPLEGP
jgi:predicted DNA-binding antitoxin AbrB/MazE fold protein